MDGVSVIKALLAADAAVLALVPIDRIEAGILPPGTTLDAISIADVSQVDRKVLKPGATRHVTERVQVTALAATYPQLKAILRAAKHACDGFIGAIAGLTGVTVHFDSAGAYICDEASSIHMKSHDFKVGYTEVR